MAGPSGAVVQWSDLAVKNCISTHTSMSSQYVNNAAEIIETLGSVAGLLKSAGQEEQLNRVREAAQQLLESRNEMRLHHDSLEQLAGPMGYTPGGDATNFKRYLDSTAANLADRMPYSVHQDPLMRRFEELATQGGGDEQIDDEIAIAGGSGPAIGMNQECPITLKKLLDLIEPVQDQMGFVYEKDAIVAHIKGEERKKRQCKCPVAGTSHTIKLTDLHPATAVLAEKKRGAKGKGRATQGATQDDGDDVLDLD